MADKDFEGLKRDANGVYIHTGKAIKTEDNTGTPQESPLAYTTSNLTLEVPTDAAEISLRPSTALRVSEESDPAGADSYSVQEAGERIVYGVADMDQLYIAGDVSGGTLQFYFITV